MAKSITSRAFNQDVSLAKRAADDGPVIITDRGRPAHVLLSFEAYLHLTGAAGTLLEALAMPGLSDIEFDAPRSGLVLHDVDLG